MSKWVALLLACAGVSALAKDGTRQHLGHVTVIRAKAPSRPPTSMGLGVEVWNPTYRHSYVVQAGTLQIEAFELVRTRKQFQIPPLNFSVGQIVKYVLAQPTAAGEAATLYVLDVSGKEHVLSVTRSRQRRPPGETP